MLTLALGIGASVTMFSVMRAVQWRPLPYPAPLRIVMLQVDARSVANAGAAPGELFDLRARSRLLEDLFMISVVDANLDFGGEMKHLTAGQRKPPDACVAPTGPKFPAYSLRNKRQSAGTCT